MKTLIFVPGYNISGTINHAVSNLAKLRKKIRFDAIYIDNYSTDQSFDLAQEKIRKTDSSHFFTATKNDKNLGYGGSQKAAFEYAFSRRYDFLVEYDGDLQYPYEKIPDLLKKLHEGEYSIVFGTRMLKKENHKGMGFFKSIGNKVLSKINQTAYRFNVSEIHTGFRGYNLNLIKNVSFKDCHNDYRWSLDSVLEIMKVNNSFSEIEIKGLYHKHKKSPDTRQLLIYSGYMIFRAGKYVLFRR